MKKKLRAAVLAVLLVVFLVSLGRVAAQFFQYREGDEAYAQAAELAGLPDFSQLPALPQPEASEEDAPDTSAPPRESQEETPQPVYVDPYADALRDMDFSALREVNGDVLGWILIPGTNVSYPVLQGQDNEYYLNHTWRKTRSSVGAIFLECRNSRGLTDFNTIIYGHRMNNRSMFGTLTQYKSQSYWAQHPYIYLTDDSGSHRYEIFAAYEVSVDSPTYQLGFSGDAARQSFLDFCAEQSVIDTGVVPQVYDRVVTLSTCTGDGHATRWVVQGVLRGEAPAEEAPAEEETPGEGGQEAGLPTGDVSAHSPPAGDVSGEEAGQASGEESQGVESGETAPPDASVTPEESPEAGESPQDAADGTDTAE